MYYSKRAGNWAFWIGVVMLITALGTGLYWLALPGIMLLVYSYREYKQSGRYKKIKRKIVNVTKQGGPGFYLGWVEAAKHGALFGPDDGGPGFYM